MKNKLSIAVTLALIIAMLVTSLAVADGTPTITSDLPDYGPGDTVNLFGTGWQVGESVHIFVNDNVGSTWSRNADVVVAGDGTFTDTFQLPSWFVATYSVTATGAISGTATTMFTDGSLQFIESGLPSGTEWSVTWNGSTQTSTTNQITFGGQQTTALFYIPDAEGYTASPSVGTAIRPQSSNTQVYITFTASDTTAPVIIPNVSGTLGNNGWYVSDATVSWTVTDAESTITSTNGCGPTTINSDTAGTILTCSATSTGGTNSQSVTIKRDATAPSISGSAAPAPNGDGWNKTGVSVSFSCSDGMSGIASCGPDQTLSGDGASQSAIGTATDKAGNSTSATVSGINIDLTAPAISGTASPAANSYGWNNTDVTVSFTCSDGLSGVKSCGPDQSLSGEGAGQFVTGTAVDYADNSASATVSDINIDKTAPTASANASPAPNANGWNNTNVTVSFSGSDVLSSIDSCSAPVILSSEGAGQSTSGTCTDKAGNVSAPASASGINIDKTPPMVAVTGVSNGAQYTLGSVPAAGCSTIDALSGVATAASLSLSGGPVVGFFTATCGGAFDNAGNVAEPVRAKYQVIYNWNGFFQPIDNGKLNVAKAGSAIPVKFSLSGYQGLNIFAVGYPSSFKINCDTNVAEDMIETTVTAGGSSLNYDTLADQYIYVWKTEKSWAGTCRQLQLKLNDDTLHTANFKFK